MMTNSAPSPSITIAKQQKLIKQKQQSENGPSTASTSAAPLHQNNSNNDLCILRNSITSMHILPSEEDIRVNSGVKPPHTDATNFWCLVYYYELNERVGEVFKAGWQRNEYPQLLIDGGVCTACENTRYCLGVIGNINRNPVVTAVRRSIGKGLRLFQRDDNIFLECLSDSAIFVQCPLFARKSGDELPTVYKLKARTGSTTSDTEPTCLFDMKLFEELLREARPRGYNALYMLQVFCLCRISFVKGWGQQYRRQTITSCPMWIEVQFPRPLQMLDRVLMECANELGIEEVHSFS